MMNEIYTAKPKKIAYIFRSMEEIIMGILCIFIPVFILLLAKVDKSDLPLIIFALLFIGIGFSILIIGPIIRITQVNDIEYVLTEIGLTIVRGDKIKRSYEYSNIKSATIEENIIDKGNQTMSIALLKSNKNTLDLTNRLYGLDPSDAARIIQIIHDNSK